jgi:acyl-CoA synthetase (AMP-forming)/AMP-acid ligase II
MDCFRFARNDAGGVATYKTVVTREGGDPVRRGFSVLSSASLEYWIAAFAAMTAGCVAAFSRRIAPELCK